MERIKKNKLFFSIVCTLIILFACFSIISILTSKNSFSNNTEVKWDGVTIASSFSLGNGTEDNPYLISNGEELAFFKELIEGTNSAIYNDKYYALSNNINLDNHEWIAMGNSLDNLFKGHFDGAGYTIKNVKVINPQVIDGVDYYGLFSIVDSGSIVNLNIDNLIVMPNSSTNLYKVGSLVADIKTSSEVSNISIYNSTIDLSNVLENENNMIGGLAASILENVKFYNIYVGVAIKSNYVNSIGRIANTLLSDADLIVDAVKVDSFTNGSISDYVTKTGNITNAIVKTNDSYALNNEVVSSDEVISLLNNKLNIKYIWISDSDLKITICDVNESIPAFQAFSFSVSNPISLHDTGIEDKTVYINDLTSDYNYYMGLNYTDFSNTGTLPTGENKNTYNDSNLVKVYARYMGEAIYDSSLVGYVSLEEQYSTFVYYKYYPVVDGYVVFELIDNPYAFRPNDKVFNGWYTDYTDAEIYLDKDNYVRYVKIPVSDVSDTISITFYANWINGKIVELNSSSTTWSSVMAGLDTFGFQKIAAIPIYEDLGDVYVSKTVNWPNSYPTGAVNNRGQSIAGNSCNNWFSSCTYYILTDSSNLDPNGTYYRLVNNRMTSYTPVIIGYLENDMLTAGDAIGGFFQEVKLSKGSSLAGYYDDSVLYYQSGVCSSNSGCVMYKEIPFYDDLGNIMQYDGVSTYYYLATRDTNVVVLETNFSESLNNAKPFTLTSIHNGVDYRNLATYNINSSYIYANADLRIEWINLTANRSPSNSSSSLVTGKTDSSYIYGNWNNLKIGRGLVNSSLVSARGVIGGGNTSTGSASSLTKYRLVIESGYYNILSLTNGMIGSYSSGGWFGESGARDYLDGMAIYGNDLDRVSGNNNNLNIYFCAAGSWGGDIYSSSEQTGIALSTVIKSGSFGTSKYDYSTGVYVGGRGGGNHYAARDAIIEGGYIYNLIGGPLTSSNRSNINDTYINIKGGSIDYVIGGAGASATYGNRIISQTGGVVNYSIFGGSNGYTGSDTGSYQGTLEGSTFIYVGGNAIVGDLDLVNNNASIFGAEAGSLFGIGNGNSDSSKIGTANNSNIIIDGNALIRRNVYGGGNYGSVGINATSSPKTSIMMLDGTVNGSIYGGGNNNGAGTTSVKAEISIIMQDGTVKGSIYGGSKAKGVVYGNSNVSVLGGSIETDVYGGGEGGYTDSNNYGTFVTDEVSVTIGTSDNDNLNINGNVYGGSAYGTVNGDSNTTGTVNLNTMVTVNNGVIKGAVYGGGKGSNTYTPKVLGNVVVNINNGNIGNVYGGNDQAGSPSGSDVVYLNGGVIGNAFGGGNNTSQNNTNIYLQGSSLTNLFGGSNTSGTVDSSNVFITAGVVNGNVYGGNNIGGTTIDTNISISGAAFNGDIYGGGSLADSTTSKILITTVLANDLYGGGEKASVDYTDINVISANLTNVFGGSNVSGEVKESTILINSGDIKNIYGSNNQGGYTDTTLITVFDGSIGNIYGGGNNALGVKSNIDIYGGNVGSIFGGGNEAGITTSNVNIYEGAIENVYGGSNILGDVSDTHINVLNASSSNEFVTVDLAFQPTLAQSWQSTEFLTYVPVTFKITNNSDVIISDWEVLLNMPLDTVIFSNYSGSDFTVENGKAVINATNKWDSNNNYKLAAGESYSFNFEILTNVAVDKFNMSATVVKPVSEKVTTGNIVINNIYGGNNMGGKVSNCFIDIDAGDIGNVYGGGNKAVVDKTNVLIDTAMVNTVFGGGNEAFVNTDTLLDINNSIITTNIYGGGNEGAVLGSTDVYLSNVSVSGSAYAGGNGSTAIVSINTTITIDGKSVIGNQNTKPPVAGSVFGSGNAAATGDVSKSNSLATVNIVGATIYGNVYGGANTSVVYGKTVTNIGTSAVSRKDLIEDDIIINGTVFGGGEANASGDENYDFEFISVTDAIDIYIDGTGYIDNLHKFLLNGSIFGSGNASSSSGTSNILVKNLGTRDNPSRNISIQRANTVVLDNSVMELSGTTDRTNEYSNIKYSFNRIDLLTIKNNTVLLLKQNANLLKQFNSMVDVDGAEVAATVTIDDSTKTVTKNVDNRLYLAPNHNLNITTNQAATAYGKITGMTFFGMYNAYDSGTFQYGVYDEDVSYGDTADASDMIIGGSYVLGLHQANHDITVDGFYTNYLSEDYSVVTTAYIEPTPPTAGYYMWIIGAQAINYTVDLNASKYSSLGALELSMPDFSAGDTTFNVIGFNSEGLRKGVSLVEPTLVPKVTSDPDDANKIFGLAIKTETREWTHYGTTKFFTDSDQKYVGDVIYKTDSQKVAPSLMFYLYHAKNISLNEEIGSVVVSLQATTPKNEIENEVRLITITVNITATDFLDANYYDASITYDKKYEMPSATSVNITNQSQFTAYYSIFSEVDSFDDFYGKDNSNYHALITNRALPVGSQITMIDIGSSQSNPKYYYYNVDSDNYQKSVNQLATDGEIEYRLSDFIKMGSIDSDNTYDDASNNLLYYSADNNYVMEEFLFIFDFKETTTTGTYLDNSILFELKNSESRSLITVLGIRQNLMFYNTYDSSNVVLNGNVNTDSDYLYYDVVSDFSLSTVVDYDQTANSEAIINTNYESSSMGLNVVVLDNNLTQVSSTMLTGTNIVIDNVRYFADSDGVFRIKLAGKVSNLNKTMHITTDKMLPSGSYTLRFTLFASADGIHNSHTLEASYVDIPIVVVGSDNSIVVLADDYGKLVDGDTGLNENQENYNEYTISSNSVLSKPNIRISVYKRNTDNKDTLVYEEVPISSLFTNYFVDPLSKGYKASSLYEKMLNITVGNKAIVKFNFSDNLLSGTYKISFKLYDNNQLIEEEIKYIIVYKSTLSESDSVG